MNRFSLPLPLAFPFFISALLIQLLASEPRTLPEPFHAQDGAVQSSKEVEFWSLKNWQPDYYLIQHSSYVGFAALGIGYGEPSSHGAFELIYGYTPEKLSGHDVHSFTGKALWRIAHFQPLPQWSLTPLFGLNVIYSPDSELFVRLPKQYSPYYYPPTAIRPAFVFGAEVSSEEGWRASLEYSVLDTELPYFSNTNRRNLSEVGSLGFVYRGELK